MQSAGQNASSILVPLIAVAGTSCGAIIGASLQYWYGGRTARKQREQESANITRALLTEIQHLNRSILLHRDWWAKLEPGARLEPLIAFATPIFEGLRDKIGQLDQEITQKIVRYYGYTFFINQLQDSGAAYEQSGKEALAKFKKRYSKVINDHIEERGDSSFMTAYAKYGVSAESVPHDLISKA